MTTIEAGPSPSAASTAPRPPRPKKRDVHGWVVLDKPVGMTSTHAVAVVKRALNAKKAGHAGTLDPLASGLLPIALGEATKTVPFVMDGRKAYIFTVSWGIETDTDDAEGRPVNSSAERPSREAVEALLPRFIGTILQTPPRFSAIKIQGERAYDLAREGEVVEIPPREVEIDELIIVAHDEDRTVLATTCGKGTYVRAIARDLGRMLGCFGHVSALRRTRVGPFLEAVSVTIGEIEPLIEQPSEVRPLWIHPIAKALAETPVVTINRQDAGRLARGQSVLYRGAEIPPDDEPLVALCMGKLVALVMWEQGELMPKRVFNSGRF